MTLTEYQMKAMRTCMPSCMNFSYMMLNLVGEVGELASKVAKAVRKGHVTVSYDDVKPLFQSKEEEGAFVEGLMLEAGDCLWELAGLCETMGWSLEDIAQKNLAKLTSRQKRGVIDGDGDNR